MITGIPTAGGQDPMALIRYMQVRDIFCNGQRWGVYYQVEDVKSPILRFLDVGAVVSHSPISALADFRPVPGGYLYKIANPLPRFFFVSAVRSVNSMDEAVTQLRNRTWDPSNLAVVEGLANATGASGHVVETKRMRNEVEVVVDAAQSGLLVSSEPNYSGWKATIDGAPAPVYNTNVAFRGVVVPVGHHRVRYKFFPSIQLYSLGISLIAWLLWLIGAIWFQPRGSNGGVAKQS